MTSPARQHFVKTSAALSRGAEENKTRQESTQYELMLAKLAEDRRRLHAVQSMEQKAVVKREILPEYQPWVTGVLEGNQGVQDDVIMTVMVWHIDAGNLPGAIPIARYAIQHNLSMPDQYKRTTACLIAEEAATMALKAITAGEKPDTASLLEIEALTEKQDMPDEVRAKLLKAIGLCLVETNKAAAIEKLKRALVLHEKSGVKKDIEKLERELKNAGSA